MELITATFTSKGAFERSSGIAVERRPQMYGPSIYEIVIGRQNKTGNFSTVRMGAPYASKLAKDAPCSRDGDATLGKCSECGIEIKNEDVKKVWETYPGSNLRVWKPVAIHTLTTKIDPVERGTFLTVSVRDERSKRSERKLLLVEERNDQGSIGLLLYAEPRKGEKTLISTDHFQPEPYNKMVGQRWLGTEAEDGVGIERLLIVKPGDRVMVKRYRGNPDWSKDVHFLIVMPDLSIKVADPKEIKAENATPQPVKATVVVKPTEPAPVVEVPKAEIPLLGKAVDKVKVERDGQIAEGLRLAEAEVKEVKVIGLVEVRAVKAEADAKLIERGRAADAAADAASFESDLEKARVACENSKKGMDEATAAMATKEVVIKVSELLALPDTKPEETADAPEVK